MHIKKNKRGKFAYINADKTGKENFNTLMQTRL